MIYVFKPFSLTKQIGDAYNAHCEITPPGSWILIMDYDAIILDPRAFQIMEEAIRRYPDTDIFSCYASRIGYNHQRLTTRIEDNDSIGYHIQIATDQATKYGSDCKNVPSIAGFFMLFSREYWERNPFQKGMFDDSGRLFDRVFCMEAEKKGKIKLIQGIYVWHTYRLGKGARDISHLL